MNKKQNKFLECWKQGVHLAGTQFFDIKSKDVESANDKNQLAPNYPYIKETFGALSHGEKVMLESLLAFKRAGCDGILSYFAPQTARILNG